MSYRHTLIALFAVVAWAVNFPVTTLALDQFTPMMIVVLRYTLVAIPTVIFVKPPTGVWKWLILYGLAYGLFQFGAVYWGMKLGTPSGIAAILIQSSAPFTVLFGFLLLREKPTRLVIVGLVVAAAGIAAIGWAGGERLGGLPALLVVLGGAGWAVGNIIIRASGSREAFRFALWMTVIPPLPALATGMLIDGTRQSFAGFEGLGTGTGLVAIAAILYIGLVATFAATGAWLYVLSRNSAGRVAPLTLLMPVLAIVIGWMALGEVPTAFVMGMAVVILAGVALTTIRERAWDRTHL